MFIQNDAIRQELLVQEYISLRNESLAAKQNQQSILQWSLAAVGVVAAATAAVVAAAPDLAALHPAIILMAAGVYGVAIPVLIACAFGVWVGEVQRMERAGRFIRAREEAANARIASRTARDDRAGEYSIMWESVISDDRSRGRYGKNVVGAMASAALFSSIFVGSLGASAAIILKSDQAATALGFWGQTSCIAVFGLAAVAFFVAFGMLLGRMLPTAGRSVANLPVSDRRTSVSLVLPCLDEEKALPWIIERLPPDLDVVVADNGSADHSAAIAGEAGLAVESVRGRRGAGLAIAAGIRRCSSDIICVMDCDGTIDPSDIQNLIAPLVQGRADFVVGRRVPVTGAMSPLHRFASAIRTRLVAHLIPAWTLSDVGSARAYRREAFAGDAFTELDGRFAWTLDATLTALSVVGSERVTEVPLPYLRRIGQSKITGTRVGIVLSTVDSLRTIGRHRQPQPVAVYSARSS